MGKYWGLEKDNKKTKIKLFKTLLRMRYEMFKYRKNKPYAEYKKEEYDDLKSGQPSELSVIEDDKIPKDLNFFNRSFMHNGNNRQKKFTKISFIFKTTDQICKKRFVNTWNF